MTWSPRWRSAKRTSMILPDYSEYLNKPEMLDWIEKEWIAKPETHEEHARIVNEAFKKYKPNVVIEIGSGTGEVAARLNFSKYVGYDNNWQAIELARLKCNRDFATFDLRKLKIFRVGLVFAFAFLKHFGLHEWKDIFNKLASLGDYLIFDMPIADQTKDDGTEYHHVWMNLDELKGHIKEAGFEIIDVKKINFDSVEPVFICRRNKL